MKVFSSSTGGQGFNTGVLINESSAQLGYDIFVNAVPDESSTAFVGGVQLYMTTDYGANFCNLTGPPSGCTSISEMHDDYHNMAINYPSNPDEIAVVCDGGIYLSTNGGSNWRSLNTQSLSTTLIYRISSHYSALQDNGFAYYNSPALTTSGDGTSILKAKLSSALLGITGNNGWGWRTFVYGVTQFIIPGYWSTNGADWVPPLTEHPTDPGKFFTARRSDPPGIINFWRSTNEGANWSAIGSVLANCAPQCLAFSTKDPQVIYMSSCSYFGSSVQFGRGLFKSTNGGANWQTIIPELNEQIIPFRYITRVITTPAEDPDDPDEVYLTLSGFYQNNNEGHIFKSINQGNTWSSINGNLPNTPVNDIVYWSASCNTDKNIAVATDVGVFVSSNNGSSWSELATGLPLVPVTDLEYVLFGNKLRAGTFGRGAWEVNLPGDSYIKGEVQLNINENVYCNIIVCSGAKLVLTDNSDIKFAAGKKLIVQNGAEFEASGTSFQGINATEWGGVEFNGNSTGKIYNNSMFVNAPTAIRIIGNSSEAGELLIENVMFNGAGNIEIESRNNVTISSCEWRYFGSALPEGWGVQCSGSNNIAIIGNQFNTYQSPQPAKINGTAISVIYGENILIYENVIKNMKFGMMISNSSAAVLDNNITMVINPSSSETGLSMSSTYSSEVKNNTITDYETGIYLNNSSPLLFQNTITNDALSSDALYAGYNSSPRMRPQEVGGETIWDAGKNTLQSNSGGEGIDITTNSIPDIDFGCNTIYGSSYHISGDVYNCNGGQYYYVARQNIWDNPQFGVCDADFETMPPGCSGGGGGSEKKDEYKDPPQPIIINYGHGIFDTIIVTNRNIELTGDKSLYLQASKNELLGNYLAAI